MDAPFLIRKLIIIYLLLVNSWYSCFLLWPQRVMCNSCIKATQSQASPFSWAAVPSQRLRCILDGMVAEYWYRDPPSVIPAHRVSILKYSFSFTRLYLRIFRGQPLMICWGQRKKSEMNCFLFLFFFLAGDSQIYFPREGLYNFFPRLGPLSFFSKVVSWNFFSWGGFEYFFSQRKIWNLIYFFPWRGNLIFFWRRAFNFFSQFSPAPPHD